ncbi:Spo0B domain-containing protein [Bacillus horti]|uniref:Stage 0 sporulation protein B (Sporulation initiation phosphotransferase) n=1 Tax=Caldalkalibacillus horti TaxID=77523 RepID=A0ABT9VTG3_9BACI|nr:Spo0B domain-containing protein [Bacillus horti]MDQ0164277.1 stage 0 sporulation protein B (sporulation initiation phosphotransferase) [Bacillus horti]
MKTDKKDLLEYLRHYRHDWMNHMQLMKAYLSMDKIQDAQRYMDQIISSAQNEAKLCELDDPELAFYLLTYNWRNQRSIRIEVEVVHEQEMLYNVSIASKYPHLHMWIREITGMIEERVDPYEENQLFYIFAVGQDCLKLRMEFEGIWDEESGKVALSKIKEKIRLEKGSLMIVECSEKEIILELSP